MIEKDEILTSAQVADMLGISMGNLATRRHRGTGPKFERRGHRTVIYRRADVDQWLKSPTGEDSLDDRVARLEDDVAELRKRVNGLARRKR